MTLGLCENRHKSPVELDGYIFPQVLDVKDFDKMKDIIFEKLINCKKLNLYVTGLTVALVEVYGFCVHNNIPLTLYHYDRETGGIMSKKQQQQIRMCINIDYNKQYRKIKKNKNFLKITLDRIKKL